jgi:hypothetical protein
MMVDLIKLGDEILKDLRKDPEFDKWYLEGEKYQNERKAFYLEQGLSESEAVIKSYQDYFKFRGVEFSIEGGD